MNLDARTYKGALSYGPVRNQAIPSTVNEPDYRLLLSFLPLFPACFFVLILLFVPQVLCDGPESLVLVMLSSAPIATFDEPWKKKKTPRNNALEEGEAVRAPSENKSQSDIKLAQPAISMLGYGLAVVKGC